MTGHATPDRAAKNLYVEALDAMRTLADGADGRSFTAAERHEFEDLNRLQDALAAYLNREAMRS